jgi:hypothetical protein
MPVISVYKGHKNTRIVVQASQRKKKKKSGRPISKIAKSKRPGGVA